MLSFSVLYSHTSSHLEMEHARDPVVSGDGVRFRKADAWHAAAWLAGSIWLVHPSLASSTKLRDTDQVSQHPGLACWGQPTRMPPERPAGDALAARYSCSAHAVLRGGRVVARLSTWLCSQPPCLRIGCPLRSRAALRVVPLERATATHPDGARARRARCTRPSDSIRGGARSATCYLI